MTKRIFALMFVLIISVSSVVSVLANTAETGTTQRLYDGADLLTDEEEKSFEDKLCAVSEKYKVDFIIATVESVEEDYTIDEYAEFFYDDGGYGYGESKDGVLLLVAMDERNYRILSNGLGAKAVTLDEISDIGEAFASYLTAENYVKAFDIFIEKCEYQINGEINGFPFKFLPNLIISVVIGAVLSLIVTGKWKGQLKSVQRKQGAANYVKAGSMSLSNSNDFFLYRTIDRQKIEKPSSDNDDNSSRNVGGGSF